MDQMGDFESLKSRPTRTHTPILEWYRKVVRAVREANWAYDVRAIEDGFRLGAENEAVSDVDQTGRDRRAAGPLTHADKLLMGVYRVDNHLPADRALVGSMLVMVLGRQSTGLFGNSFTTASHAAKNSRVVGLVPRAVDFVEGRVIGIGDVVGVFVQSHWSTFWRRNVAICERNRALISENATVRMTAVGRNPAAPGSG